jgi:hypothetical protein
VLLFIDRLPIHQWVDNTHTPPIWHWSIRLAVLPSPSGLSPSTVRPQQWVVDTGYTDEAFAWRYHLEDAGLNPDTDRGAPVQLRGSANMGRVQVPVRRADLWLVSNLPQLPPFSLPLQRGIAFHDRRVAAPDPESQRALVGMRPLIRAGLKVEVDFASRTVSLWTP